MNLSTAVLLLIMSACLGFVLALSTVYWGDFKDHKNEQLNAQTTDV